jgi:hypothetical protein
MGTSGRKSKAIKGELLHQVNRAAEMIAGDWPTNGTIIPAHTDCSYHLDGFVFSNPIYIMKGPRSSEAPKHHSATTSQISINAEALSPSPSTPLPLHHHPYSSLLCNFDSITNDNIIRLLIFIYSKIFTTMFMIGDPIMCE